MYCSFYGASNIGKKRIEIVGLCCVLSTRLRPTSMQNTCSQTTLTRSFFDYLPPFVYSFYLETVDILWEHTLHCTSCKRSFWKTPYDHVAEFFIDTFWSAAVFFINLTGSRNLLYSKSVYGKRDRTGSWNYIIDSAQWQHLLTAIM